MSIVRPAGIAGLEGREPVGAVLTIGHKGPTGNPTDTDRFFIVQTQEENGIRPNHPAFNAYNGADPERRRSMRGVLVHAAQSQAFEHYLRAQVIGKAHPLKMPACTGDGHTARRWTGPGPDDFTDIKCPHDLCEFRAAVGNKPTPCKPFGRLYFQPVWAAGSPAPTPLMKLTTGSWNTVRAMVGFFDYIAQQAAALGVTRYSLFGLGFTLTLTKKKRAGDSGGRSFPVLSMSPEGNLQSFLYGQRVAEFGAAPALPAPVSALEDRDPEEEARDLRGITPGLHTEAS